MITHYEVLEVPEQATANDVRRAYRRLVLLTHPDRTPDPAAHQRYLAINRAYDVLSAPPKRQLYDAQLWALRHPPPPPRVVPPPHPDPAYRGPMPRPILRRRPAGDPYAAAYARYTPIAKLVCRVLIAFGLLLVLDSQWIVTLPDEPVLSQTYYVQYGRRGSVTDRYYQIETPKSSFRYWTPYEPGQLLTVTRTVIFRQVLTHRPVTFPAQASINNQEETIYAPPLFVFSILMWVAAVVGVWPGPVRRRTVDAAITAFMFALISLYVLLRG